jgi:hypothetical protein
VTGEKGKMEGRNAREKDKWREGKRGKESEGPRDRS